MRAQPSVGGPDDKSLKAGLTELGLGGQGELERNLRGYMLLLAKWNQTYNLISSRTTAETLSRHILDSLVVLPFLDGSRVLDVGTGAGLPGMVLAMADPRRHYTLLDVNAKKIRFCRQACAELSLTNVDVVQSRVQDYAPGRGVLHHRFQGLHNRGETPGAGKSFVRAGCIGVGHERRQSHERAGA